ncbi:tRNA (guanine(10)-N(2))-dimethyltransferase [Candidatus Altiarchaeales archaeon WOR_SM1_SCG]|nr:tRNA (guanine(10)-N(2))-dimethyltransferase [Candidatus Altiarchaeales archaeon WOR_SM1_SCG]
MTPTLTEIQEGTTKLLVPVEEKLLKKNPVFYNPEMEFSRDISVAATRVLKPENFCDLLCASGARGVRIANETGTPVIANDINPLAYELIKKNISLNNLNDTKIIASNLNAQELLTGKNYDFIDVDPFGSPVHFTDSLFRSIKNRGTLAITATDTAALCGTYPKACRRKYDSQIFHTEYYNELGLRVLIGFATRNSLKYDTGITPLFSHCTRHYFRMYLRVRRGSKYVNENLKNIKYIQHCFSCLKRVYRNLDELKENCSCGGKFNTAGPLWSGNFADAEFCEDLAAEIESGIFNTKGEAQKIISKIKEEQEIHVPYYDIHKICKKLKVPSPGMEKLTQNFRENNFKISRTHFSGTGIRTDAGINEIKEFIIN